MAATRTRMIRGLAIEAKHARDDAKADAAYERRKSASRHFGGHCVRSSKTSSHGRPPMLPRSCQNGCQRLTAPRQIATHGHGGAADRHHPFASGNAEAVSFGHVHDLTKVPVVIARDVNLST